MPAHNSHIVIQFAFKYLTLYVQVADKYCHIVTIFSLATFRWTFVPNFLRAFTFRIIHSSRILPNFSVSLTNPEKQFKCCVEATHSTGTKCFGCFLRTELNCRLLMHDSYLTERSFVAPVRSNAHIITNVDGNTFLLSVMLIASIVFTILCMLYHRLHQSPHWNDWGIHQALTN